MTKTSKLTPLKIAEEADEIIQSFWDSEKQAKRQRHLIIMMLVHIHYAIKEIAKGDDNK